MATHAVRARVVPVPDIRKGLAGLLTVAGGLDAIMGATLKITDNLVLALVVLGAILVMVLALWSLAQVPMPRVPNYVLPEALAATMGVMFFLVVQLLDASVQPISVTIAQPLDHALVNQQDIVRGTVSDPAATVFVMVASLEEQTLYVQPPAIVGRDGAYSASVYYGEPHLGNHDGYFVIATATHENAVINWLTGNRLHRGDHFDALPTRTNRSDVVTVTRNDSTR